ncbi:MAG TPA: hypothetical protein VMU83_06915 [Hanamia sp.]|nr:hypothetical protein [Hanamia sp.]
MTNHIENIYSDFRTNYENNPDFSIHFYKANSIYLSNIKDFKNKQDLKYYIEIICKYTEAIYQKDHYNLAIDIIDEKQIFIDNEIKRLNADELKNRWYYSLQFVKGMASYHLKDYKTATSIFKKLVQFDNQNDLYKRWLTYSQYGLNLWLVRTINIFCAILVLTEIIFESRIKSFYVRISMLAIGLLGLLSNWTYEYYIKRSFRKKNSE